MGETDPGAFILLFGKHKGKPLSAIPAGYLTWVLDNVTTLYPKTRAAIEAHIGRPVVLSGDGPSPAVPVTPATTRAGQSRGIARATCSVCGLHGTAERPLVHARCVDGDVPF